jgi:tRNA 2-thiouridine synthesizing protein A
MNAAEVEMDLRGLKCPLPALLIRRHLTHAAVGTVVTVITDDPMAPVDVPHMCHGEGFEVLKLERRGDEARMVLRRP